MSGSSAGSGVKAWPLADPRRWPASDDPLQAVVRDSLAGQADIRTVVESTLDGLLEEEEDATLTALLNHAPSAESYRHLQQLLATRVNKPRGDESVVARLFAIPLVIVAGARGSVQLPAALPDIGAVTALLHSHGVTGADRNVGLGNALIAPETLAAAGPVTMRAWATRLSAGGGAPELPGTPLTVTAGREQVHLRFLVGASVVPAHVPTFIETGANVGIWGMPLTRLLAQQLAAPGLDLLPMARPPVPLFLAADAGRAAQIELAFTLFLSNAVRDMRRATGDPAVVLSSHLTEADTAGGTGCGGGELRVSLSSPFDESALEGFRWPLYPADAMGDVLDRIASLLHDCGLHDVRLLAGVAPDLNARGGRFFTLRDVSGAQRPM